MAADTMQATAGGDVVEARGNVVLTREDSLMRAEFVRYFTSSGWVYLEGDVRIRWGDYDIAAEQVEYNLEGDVGWIREGTLFIENRHVYIRAGLIRKLGRDSYSFREAEFTACDGDRPPWSVVSHEMDLTVEGMAHMWHPRMRVLDVPVLYLPYATFPAKTRRASGLLFPKIGYSDLLGGYYSQPLYWAAGDEFDMTATESYFHKRGLGHGLELRHANSPRTQGFWKVDYLNDRQVAPTEGEESEQFQGDGLVRPNQDRYWVRSMFDGWFDPLDLSAKMDIDYVSDQNYLREFEIAGALPLGFEDVGPEGMFGRSFDTDSDLTRQSRALVSREFTTASLHLGAFYTQNLHYMNDNQPESKNPTVQRLPEANGLIYRDDLWLLPLEFEATTEAVNFWRRYGVTGQRLQANPRVSLPLDLGLVSLVPSAGWRQTQYYIDRREFSDPAQEAALAESDDPERGLPELQATSFTEFYRIYDLGEPGAGALEEATWTALKHSLQPRVGYFWTPRVEQDDLPSFDAQDRIAPGNLVSYSLTNRLTGKSVNLASDNDGGFREITGYHEFLWMRLEQSYDINEARRDESLDVHERRPFSDLLLETGINPGRHVTLGNKTFYSPYEGRIIEHEHSISFNNPGTFSLKTSLDFLGEIDEYKRRRDSDLQIFKSTATLYLPLGFTLTGTYKGDVENREDISKGLTLHYDHQCFDVRFDYLRKKYEEQFELQFRIMEFDLPELQF